MATALVFSLYKFGGGGGAEQPLVVLAYFTFFIIILQAIVLAIYLSAIKGHANASVGILTGGKLAGGFWGGVVAAAVILPLIFEGLKAFSSLSSSLLLVLALIGGIIGLSGGYMLRNVIVRGGARSLLNVQGVLVEPPPETYRTKVIQQAEYESFQKP
jgi:formate-dependent nitrite reductase membrane component NrfD